MYSSSYSVTLWYKTYTQIDKSEPCMYTYCETCDWCLEHKLLISGLIVDNATRISSSSERSLFLCFDFIVAMAENACSHRYDVEKGKIREIAFLAKLVKLKKKLNCSSRSRESEVSVQFFPLNFGGTLKRSHGTPWCRGTPVGNHCPKVLYIFLCER